MVCGPRDGLGLATSTSRRLSKPSAPGTSQFPAGKGGGAGQFWGRGSFFQKKMRHGRTRGFGVVRRCEAADAADGWLDDRREAGAE
jgi:hypothetical protein